MFRDYEQPIIPPDWKGPWRTFAQMVIRVFDELHMGIKAKDLDESLKKQIDGASQQATDTGWVDITSCIDTTKFNPTTDYMMVRRVGDFVHMRFAGNITSAMSFPRWQDISSAIPEKFRPIYPVECLLPASSNDPGWIRVNTDGTLQIYRRTGSADNGWWMSGTIMYTVGGTPLPST